MISFKLTFSAFECSLNVKLLSRLRRADFYTVLKLRNLKQTWRDSIEDRIFWVLRHFLKVRIRVQRLFPLSTTSKFILKQVFHRFTYCRKRLFLPISRVFWDWWISNGTWNENYSSSNTICISELFFGRKKRSIHYPDSAVSNWLSSFKSFENYPLETILVWDLLFKIT